MFLRIHDLLSRLAARRPIVGKLLLMVMCGLFCSSPVAHAAAHNIWQRDIIDPHVGYPIAVAVLLISILGLILQRYREKQVLNQLSSSHNQIEIALDSATMGLWEWNIAPGSFIADDRCCIMLGYTKDEVPENLDWWSEQVHPNDRRQAKTSLIPLLRGKADTYRSESRIRTKTGEWRVIAERGKVTEWNPDGTPSRASGAHIDVTEQHALQESQRRLAIVVEQASETIIVTDTKGKIEYVNPSFAAKLGYSEEEAIGNTPKLFRSGKHDKTFYTNMRKDLDRGHVWEGKLLNNCKDGTIIELETTISPVKNEHDQTTHYVAIGRDVTHEHLLETQLRLAQKMEALGTLAGGIAHDFNNILSAVIGYTELAMQDTEPKTPAHTDMQEVFKAATRAADLVSQILTFSRRTEQERKPLLLAPVIKETLKLIRGTLPSTIEIKQTISKDSPPVLADPTQMHQILMNLCTNASHAMREEGGTLEVRLDTVELKQELEAGQLTLTPGRYAKLSVCDSGHGMTQEIRQRIFEPYFTTKRGRDGTGLGLATVHGIVKLHEGAVTVYSEEGQGTTFNIFLPVCIPTVEDGDGRNSVAPMPRGKGECILVVDDEESIVQMIEITLGHLGYNIEPFTSSVKALKAFEDNPNQFQCVITDQTMPTLTGANLARRILALRPDLPVILCSGFSESVNDQKAHEIGIQEFIMKPMTSRVLADAVHRAINAQS